MTAQLGGLVVMLVTCGIALIGIGTAVIVAGVLVDDALPFERETAFLWMALFGVGVGKGGIDALWMLELNGGWPAWVSFGVFVALLCVLVIASLCVPVSLVDVALGGESFVFEDSEGGAEAT